MLFDRGFATLDDVKNRLGIASSSTSDDSVLNEIIRATAATIERVSGRPLRRRHGQIERLSGGSRTVRLSASPIAKIHYIRESTSRDFTDPDNYTELVEGTDFIMEAAEGQRPGETGVLRRLNRNWMGDEVDRAGQIQALYTGGYKTDDEVDLEDVTVAIQSAPLIYDYTIQKQTSGYYIINKIDTSPISAGAGLFGTISRAFIRFDTSALIFPIWTLLTIDLDFYASASDESQDLEAYVNSVDGENSDLAGIYGDLDSDGDAVQFDVTTTITTLQQWNLNLQNSVDIDAVRSAITSALHFGGITFGFRMSEEGDTGTSISITSSEGSASVKPILTIQHRKLSDDLWVVPGDLRHANALQASHEYQQRRSVGVIGSSKRGVAVASGAAVQKLPIDVLPEVNEIAKRYSRLY